MGFMPPSRIPTLAEIDEFGERLRSLVMSLGDVESANAGARRPQSDSLALEWAVPRRKRQRPGRRPGAAIEAATEMVLRLLRSSESGLRMGDLVAAAGGHRFRVRRAVARLREAGRIRMTGSRSVARYFAAR